MFSRAKLGKISSKVREQSLFLEQVFPASRDQVFQAFTDGELLKKWWGPNGWELTYCAIDAAPEGEWHYCLTCTDNSKEYAGQQSWGKSIYVEVDAPNRIVYRDFYANEQGEIDPNVPEALVSIQFSDQAKFTRVVSETRYSSKEELDNVMKMGLVAGITETWMRLDKLLREK